MGVAAAAAAQNGFDSRSSRYRMCLNYNNNNSELGRICATTTTTSIRQLQCRADIRVSGGLH